MEGRLIDDSIAKHNVVVLTIAQALLGAQLPMIFTVGGLAGTMLAPNPCLATLPISLIVFGSMTTSVWLSMVMQRFGRMTGFMIGSFAGFCGALLAATGIAYGSFTIFLAGSYLTGIYQSAQGFLRFAGTDTASDEFRPKAVSYVLAGGLVAAIIGPQLVKVSYEAFGTLYLGTYLAAAGINLVGIWVFLFLRKSGLRHDFVSDGPPPRTRWELLKTPEVSVAMICAMVTYALMNLMMTSTPLAVVGCGYEQADAANVVSGHVLAMFVPSFFTGHLIARFGTRAIISTGLVILGGAGLVALAGTDLTHFFGALILLGIGWNFGFIGATTMLASAHTPNERGRVQGLNDLMVFGAVTFASLASGGLMNCSGGTPQQGWHAVTLAMLPFLTLAGGALLWLALRPQAEEWPGE